MKPIGNSTLLISVIFILIALNLGLVTFMWFTQHTGNHEGPTTTKFLITQLKFSKQQEEQYAQLQRNLGDSMEPIHEKERKIHDRFFEMIHADNPDSALVASTIDTMGHIRSQIESLTFVHFRQVRAICNTEQQKKFDSIIAGLMHRMGPPPPPHHGGPQHDGPPHDGPDGPPPPDGPPAH
jgi:Spy/CpxP family protein refolding chaperone